MEVTITMVQTVNGYIARTNGETPWSAEEYHAFYSSVKKTGNMVIGRTTYEAMNGANDFDRLKNVVTVVVTRRRFSSPGKNILAVKSPKEAIALLKSKGFKRIMIAGGSRLNLSVLRQGLANRLCVDVEPLIFGTGIPLIHEGNLDLKLKLLKITRISKNTLQFNYRILTE